MENKKRLIDEFKSEVMSEFIRLCNGNDYNKLTLLKIGDTIDRLYEKYRILPTVDAVEVVHGRWNMDEEMYAWNCSVCRSISLNGRRYSYCHNCGAKMDGDGNA